MIAIPAVDLRGGHAIQLVGGDPRNVKVQLPDPVAVACDWAKRGASFIHVVDLDRALGTGSNQRLVERILEGLVPLGARAQVGGGLRFTEDIDDLFNLGAARVVVGTRAVTEEDFLEDAARRYGRRLTVAVDARGDEIVVKGWTEKSGKSLEAFAKRAADLGVGALLYTDVGREGRMEGPNVEGVRRLAASVDTPIIASGGVASLQDLLALEKAGAWGAIVGMAFYTGRIRFEDAAKALKGEP